jgi:hypothetical protein
MVRQMREALPLARIRQVSLPPLVRSRCRLVERSSLVVVMHALPCI